MKRDVRLHGLTSDHHHALLLAFRVRTACERGVANSLLASEVGAAFDEELAPHFAIEEEILLAALVSLGERDLVDRTLSEHARLRDLAARAARGETAGLSEFAQVLHDHVRFEENLLFPACEQRLPGHVLDTVAQRAPKDRRRRPTPPRAL